MIPFYQGQSLVTDLISLFGIPFLLLPYLYIAVHALDKDYHSLHGVASCRKRPQTSGTRGFSMLYNSVFLGVGGGRASCCGLCSFSVLSLRLGDTKSIFQPKALFSGGHQGFLSYCLNASCYNRKPGELGSRTH